jgi:uncharacterized membrane protein YfcA
MVMILLAGLVIAMGAFVQGTAGIGLALVAAPLLAIVEPRLIPVPLLVVAIGHALLTLRREWGDADWSGVGWALLGRLPGVALGVLMVAALSPRGFRAVVAIIVLVCAALSTVRWQPRPTRPALLAAGLVSGAGGTAAAIGGPPVALLYQRASGARVRATMAAYFAVGSVLSMAGLAIGGQVDADGLYAGSLLLPFMIVGYLLSTPARRVLDRGWVRPAVLGLALAGAIGLLVQVALSG